jgi:hypothetical protein
MRKLMIQSKGKNMLARNPASGVEKKAPDGSVQLLASSADKTENFSRFSNVIDSVITGCREIIASCEQTLKDIGDTPTYFEMSQNFIKEYKAINGFDAFMPLSSLAYQMQRTSTNSLKEFLPLYSIGTKEFKWSYGTRGLLQDYTKKLSLEQAPSVVQICERYNMSVDVKHNCNKDLIDLNFKTVVQLQRFLYEVRHINNLNPTLPNRYVSYVDADLFADDAAGNSYKSNLFQVNNDLQKVLRLTESADINESINDVVKAFGGERKGKANLAIQNIIDLNIVPINVHALMREIPLVNIYNYAFTFDMMMLELLNSQQVEGKELADRRFVNRMRLCDFDNTAHIYDAKDALVALMIDPTIQINENMVRTMMMGDAMNKELGRPKFLSDQLWSKVLLHDLYNDVNQHESGPHSTGGKLVTDQHEIINTNIVDKAGNVLDYEKIYELLKVIRDLQNDDDIQVYLDRKGYKIKGGAKSLADTIEEFNIASNAVEHAIISEDIITNADGALSYKERLEVLKEISKLQYDVTEIGSYLVAKKYKRSVNNTRIALTGTIKGIKTSRVSATGDRYTINHGFNKKHTAVPASAVRFNTALIRNITFIVNLFRIVRMKFHRDVVYSRDIVLRSAQVSRPEITEFRENEVDVRRPKYSRM